MLLAILVLNGVALFQLLKIILFFPKRYWPVVLFPIELYAHILVWNVEVKRQRTLVNAVRETLFSFVEKPQLYKALLQYQRSF